MSGTASLDDSLDPRSGRKPMVVVKRILSEATAMSFRRRDHGALRKPRRLRHDLLEDEGHGDARGILLRRGADAGIGAVLRVRGFGKTFEDGKEVPVVATLLI